MADKYNMYEKELNFDYLEGLDKWRETHEDNVALRAMLTETSERLEIVASELRKDPYDMQNIREAIDVLSIISEGLAKKNDTKKISQIC